MTPGNLIRIGPRFWRVTGVHLGAIGQESAIAVQAIGINPAWDEIPLSVMHVPEAMILALLQSGAATAYQTCPYAPDGAIEQQP